MNASEVIDFAGNLTKAISQIEVILSVRNKLNDLLKITDEYDVRGMVVSANSVGASWLDRRNIQIVRESDFISKLASSKSLFEIYKFIEEEKSLPVEGIDYEVIEKSSRFKNYELSWKGYKVKLDFDPHIMN